MINKSLLNTTLVITNAKGDYSSFYYSEHDIFCSSELKSSDFEGREFIQASDRFFDIEEIFSQIDRKIDLVILTLEVDTACFPVNLHKIKCPKIVLINDTYHSMYPLSTLINYLKQEKVEYILTSAQPAHLHFFYEIGIKHSALYPRSIVKLDNVNYRRAGVSYFGDKWKSSHLRRCRMLQFLEKELPDNDIPFYQYDHLPYLEWLKILSRAEMVVISSLNGQFTPQLYNALSSGALCFIDELSHQTLLYQFFKSGKHLVIWKNFEDLLSKIIYYYNHPNEMVSIARAGRYQVENNFVSTKNIGLMVSDFVFKDKINPKLLAINDKRCQDKRVEHTDYFDVRIRLYENIQELHRIHESLKLISFTQENLKVISDLADLPRLKITHASYSNTLKIKADKYFKSVDVDHQIETIISNKTQNLSEHDIGILETRANHFFWMESVTFISASLNKNSLLFILGEIPELDYHVLRREGFKPYKFKENFIKKISKKICLWFWKRGKYPFPYLTLKPAMKTVPNLNVFIRGWQSKLQNLY